MVMEGDIAGPYSEAAIGRVLRDWPQLVAAVPGVAQLTCEDRSFSGNLVLALPFGQLRCRLSGEVQQQSGDGLVIAAKGRAVTLAGAFEARVTASRLPFGGGLHYAISLTTSGRLASLGESMLSNVSATQAPQFERSVRLLLEQA